MKKVFKGLALSLALLTLVSSSAFAWSPRIDTRGGVSRDLSTPNDIFCDDFAQASDLSSMGWSTSVAGDSTIGLAQTIGPNGKKQQALLISDKVAGATNSGGVIKKTIGEITSGTVSLEIRFKMEVPNNTETTFASNGLYLMTPASKWATRFYVLGDLTGGSINWNGSGSSVKYQSKITPGAWYTFTMDADLDQKVVNTILKSDVLDNGFYYKQSLTFLDDFLTMATPTVTQVMFESRMFTADWYIDYIRVVRNSTLVEKMKPSRPVSYITAPLSDTPVMRAVPYSVNVMRDGIYRYFTRKPELSGEDVMVTARSAFRVFGLTTTIADGKYTATDGTNEVVMSVDGSSLKVNGKSLSKISVSDGDVLVSLNELAAALGESASWNSDEETLYITKGGN